jgi:transcriptional regulator with XRE-family HTH domain
MLDEGVRTRLRDAIEASGRSMRNISTACGFGPSYLSGILNEGKEPSYSRLMRVCKELQVSHAYIFYGARVTPTQEKIAQMLGPMSDEEVDALIAFLGMFRRGE